MSAYILVSYDVVDPEAFQSYVPAVQELLREHGAEVVVGAFDAKPLEGEKRDVYVVLRFDSPEAALAWYGRAGVVRRSSLRADQEDPPRLVWQHQHGACQRVRPTVIARKERTVRTSVGAEARPLSRQPSVPGRP